MAGESASMELKVLINILSQGTALKSLLADTKSLTSALTDLQEKTKKASDPTQPIKKHLDEGGEAAHRAAKGIEALNASMDKAIGMVKFLAGGFLALESVRFLKDLADTAARAEVLSTVLHVVGNNAGYTTAQLDKADRQVQAMGITASAARQSLTQFIQAQLDLAKAPELARAAQDAAVILGTNSSVAFERLVTAVQTSNTLMLRHMGITVQAEAAYSKFAISIGKTAGQLTSLERTQAFLNATLVETRRIAGAYTAAMGDVGKQIQSLDRFIENLKESLGRQLLPAYLAIVEELTLFLQHMGLASDAMYGQGEGAKKLGDDVRKLASALRQIAEFAMEHRVAIGRIIELWALFAYVIGPLSGKIGGLQKAIAAPVEGGVIARLGIALGGLAGVFLTIGGIIIFLQLTFDKFDAAIGTIVGTIWTGVDTILVAVGALFKGVESTTKMVFNVLQHPFTADSWKKPWEEWEKFVKGRIQAVYDMWENTKARFKQVFVSPGEEPGDKRTAAMAARQKSFQAESELMTEISVKTREYDDLKSNPAATKEMIKNTELELDALKKKGKAQEETRKSEQDALHYTQAMREMEAERLKENAKYLDQKKLQDTIDKARQGAKFSYTPEGGEVGMQFSQQLVQFNDLLRVYNTESNTAGLTTKELVRNLREAGGLTKTRTELEQLSRAVTELGKTDPKSAAAARDILAQARLQVEQTRLQETAQILARRQEDISRSGEAIAEADKKEQTELKNTMEAEGDILEDQYKQNLVLLDDYYDKRITRIEKEAAVEAHAVEDQIVTLERRRNAALERSDTRGAEAFDLQIKAQQNQLAAIQGRTQTQVAALRLQQETRRRDLNRELKQELLDQQASTGGIVQQLAQLNNQLELEKKKYAELGTPLSDQLIALKRLTAEAEIYAKARQQALEIEQSRLRILQEEMSLAKQQREVAAARDRTAVAHGEMTEDQARRRNNARIEDAMFDNRLQKAQKEQQLRRDADRQADDRLRLQGQSQELMMRQAMTEEEAARQMTVLQQQQTSEIIAGQAALEGYDQAYQDLATSVELTSDKIRASFTNALADAITNSIMQFGKMADVWRNMAKAIASDIIGIFAKMVAQSAVNNLMSVFTGMMGGGGGKKIPWNPQGLSAAEGGVVVGPGSGTSDSVPAMVSAGEHIMPASKAAQWMPLLEGIRLGTILPAYALGGVVALQSISMSPIIPRRYATGGVVVSDGGAASVQTGGGGGGNLIVSLHPDALHMTMREWLEHEVVRQHGRR